MKENIYVIYDRESGITLKPFMVQRNDVAPLREFEELVSNKETIISKHASDFDLVHIGTIDLETMQLEPISPRSVARGIDLVDDKP